MSNWFSWEETLNELGQKDFEVLGLFPKGLQPYSPKGQAKIFCPQEYHLYSHKLIQLRKKINKLNTVRNSETPDQKRVKELEQLVEELENEIRNITEQDQDCNSWKFVKLPNTDEGIEQLIHVLDLENAIFKRDNVEEIKRKLSLYDAETIQDEKILPCKTGTKWESVKITLVSCDVVRIETPQGQRRFSYHDLELADNRTRDKKPGMLWALFKLFAKNQGYIKPTNIRYNAKLPDTAKRLNKHLQNLFNIPESIFTDHYKVEKGYKTKIFFSDQTQVI